MGDCQPAMALASLVNCRLAAFSCACSCEADFMTRFLTGGVIGFGGSTAPTTIDDLSGRRAKESEAADILADADAGAAGCERMDQTARAAIAQISKAVATPNERLNARRGFNERVWARCQTALKFGAVCSSANFSSLNSARISFSSPIDAITQFHRGQRLAQALLATLIMLPCTAN